MGYLHLACIMMVAMATVLANPEMRPNIAFGKVTMLVDTIDQVFQMERDISKADGSFIYCTWNYLRSSNSTTTSTLTAIQGSFITGFKQLNSTHIAIADYSENCIRILNRVENSLDILAGTCGTSGYVEGPVGTGRLNSPYGVEVDVMNPGRLLVTDDQNHALRSVDLQTGELGTVVKSNFSFPRSTLWVDGKLLVVNRNYISEVAWLSNSTVTNTILVGSTTKGDVHGHFNESMFWGPSDIIDFGNGTQLIAEERNCKLKLMNRGTGTIHPVVIKSAPKGAYGFCPHSLYKSGDDVYIGIRINMFKLSKLN